MSTINDTMNTIAKMMVMRSRFFSTMLVPVCEEYTELAIMSDMPVPLPECSRMNTMRPTPETTSKINVMMRSGFKVRLSSFVRCISVRKSTSIAKRTRQGKRDTVQKREVSPAASSSRLSTLRPRSRRLAASHVESDTRKNEPGASPETRNRSP